MGCMNKLEDHRHRHRSHSRDHLDRKDCHQNCLLYFDSYLLVHLLLLRLHLAQVVRTAHMDFVDQVGNDDLAVMSREQNIEEVKPVPVAEVEAVVLFDLGVEVIHDPFLGHRRRKRENKVDRERLHSPLRVTG